MSNYSQTTFFTPKDTLPANNPAKTIFGAAYDVEFGNISTAIASKADATAVILSIAGTTNQVAATTIAGATTLSLPPNVVIPTPSSGVGLLVNGVASAFAMEITAPNTAGVSRGLEVLAGTNASDFSVVINNAANTTNYLIVYGDGGVQLGAATGGDKGLGTLNATGLFVNNVPVLTGAGFVTSIAGTANQIATSASTGAVTLSLPPNIVLPTPAGGISLSVPSTASNFALALSSTTGAAGILGLGWSVGIAGSQWNIVTQSTDPLTIGTGGTVGLTLATNSNTRITISGAGAVSISAPSTGSLNALSVAGANGGGFAATLSGSSTTSNSNGLSINAGTNSSDLAFQIFNQGFSAQFLKLFGDGHGNLGPSSTLGLSWAATGAVSMAAPTSGSSLTINGVAGATFSNPATVIQAAGTANQSNGLFIHAGTGQNDLAINLTNAANSTTLLNIFGDGSLVAGSATGGPQGLGTINASGLFVAGVAVATGTAGTTGSFSAGTTGLSGATASCKWTKIGTSVILFIGVPSTLTSSATGFTFTGLPATIQPTTPKYAAVPGIGLNNSAVTNNVDALVSGSTITLSISGVTAAWTAVGNKTIGDGTNGATLVYDVS